jgi:hypothetical protein
MKRHLSFVAALGMYFFASTAAYTQQVKLDTGGIAIGGSVSSSTISNRHPQRETGRAAAGFGLPHDLIFLLVISPRTNRPTGRDASILSSVFRSRGTGAFYQIRVSTDTFESANNLCADIRRAGGACMVLRNGS